MQWKVRRTLASSIHELGAILGEEVSAADLIPVFNGFLKDLDEVGYNDTYFVSLHVSNSDSPVQKYRN